MSELPELKGPARLKPISYNPDKDKFIYYDDIIQQIDTIYPIDQLTQDQQKKLVLERLQKDLETNQIEKRENEPVIQMGFGGPALSNDEMINQIKKQTNIGKSIILSEITYLRDYIQNIEEALLEKESQQNKENTGN